MRSPVLFASVSSLVVVLAGCATSHPTNARPPSPFEITATPFLRYGPVTGRIQVGRGGAPGTSSPGRPKLHEIGVRHAEESGLDLVGSWQRDQIELEASELRLIGRGTLDDPLVSQGTSFPAGASVLSRTSIDLARLGYRHEFDLPLGAGDRIEVWPGIGADLFRLDYRLTGPDGRLAARTFAHVAPDVDLTLAFTPGGSGPLRFSLHASRTLEFLLPKSDRLNLSEADLDARYALSPTWSVHLEIGVRRVEFEDDQVLPNHPDVRFGPFFGLGLGATF